VSRPSWRAVLLDLDGTVVDSAPGLRAAVNRLLAEERRRPLALGEVVSMIGDGTTALVRRAFLATGAPAAAAELGGLVTRFHDHCEAVALPLTAPYPGVAETLERLRDDGLALAVCTNKLQRLTMLLLAGLGLDRHFRLVIGGGSVAAPKPDPRPLLAALDGLGVEPRAAVMVGDGVNDVLAARRAGTAMVVARYGYGASPDELRGDASIEAIHELPETLRRLQHLH
jgi:phosphoglycolate phosphatase